MKNKKMNRLSLSKKNTRRSCPRLPIASGKNGRLRRQGTHDKSKEWRSVVNNRKSMKCASSGQSVLWKCSVSKATRDKCF